MKSPHIALAVFLCSSFGFASLGAGVARAQDTSAPTEPEPQPVTPPSAAPADVPPLPPPQPPAPPVQVQQDQQQPDQQYPQEQAYQAAPQPVPQMAPAPQPQASSGQWVYTEQYGWVWMPYGNQYTYEGTAYGSEPYAYVYYPTYGWTWLAAPWVWGWGAYPYFGGVGPGCARQLLTFVARQMRAFGRVTLQAP